MPLGYANGSYLHAAGTRASFESASAQLEREGYPAIVVNWGDREYETQVRVFLERYVTADNIRGRKVYGQSVVWNGTRYYRISDEGVVAVPSTGAPHVARRAADLAYPYNSNTPARRRLVQIAAAHDLAPTGDNFDEPWHFEKKGNPGAVTGSPASSSKPTPAAPKPPQPYSIGDAPMFIAAISPGLHPTYNGWFIIQDGRATVLSGNGGNAAQKAGIAVIPYDDKNAVAQLVRQYQF